MSQMDGGRDKTAIYSKVAYDLAARIAAGELPEGAGFSGRSLMGTTYHVSQETIRRAMNILADMEIIEIRPNRGAKVISREKATEFLEKYHVGQEMHNLKAELQSLRAQRLAIDERIGELMAEILDLNERFEKSNPLRNYEFLIEDSSPLAGISIRDCEFRSHTGALIVAIKRGEQIFLSPDPDMVFQGGDTVVTAGSPTSAAHVAALFKGEIQL